MLIISCNLLLSYIVAVERIILKLWIYDLSYIWILLQWLLLLLLLLLNMLLCCEWLLVVQIQVLLVIILVRVIGLINLLRIVKKRLLLVGNRNLYLCLGVMVRILLHLLWWSLVLEAISHLQLRCHSPTS